MALATILAACGIGTPYFSEGGAHYGGSLATGRTLYLGLAGLTARPGDHVRLHSLEVPGLDDTWHTALVQPLRPGADGIGGVYDDTLLGGIPARDLVEPLDGFALTEADGHVMVVLALTPPAASVIHFDRVTVRFSVNGQGRAQTWETGATVCVDAPAPTACELQDG